MRARNIKPAFFKNAELADAGLATRLLFIGLWCMADREGRLKDKPRVIKAEIFPFDHDDEVDVIHSLSTLEQMGLILRYVSQGIAVIEVANFKRHQSPHHTEKASDLPSRTSNGEVTVKSPSLNGGNPSDSLIPDSLNHDSLIPDSSARSRAPGAKKTTDVVEDPEKTPEKTPEVYGNDDEAWRMWQRVEAAIVVTDLQASFPADSKTVKTIGLIGGWRKLGSRSRDQRGQTQQQFLTTYRSLP